MFVRGLRTSNCLPLKGKEVMLVILVSIIEGDDPIAPDGDSRDNLRTYEDRVFR